MSLTLTNKTIDKYFGFLSKLDSASKKKLIIKLTESIESEKEVGFDINQLYGAWVDERTSDEIIDELRSSRVEKLKEIDF